MSEKIKVYKYFGFPDAANVEEDLGKHIKSRACNRKSSLEDVVGLVNERTNKDNRDTPLAWLNSLLTGHLYFPRLETFNDPFECLMQVNAKTMSRFLRKNHKHSKTISTRLSIRKSARKTHGINLYPYAQDIRHHGVMCFGQQWNNHLMWGHYTNSGNGVCLEYEVDVSLHKCIEDLGGGTTIKITGVHDANQQTAFVVVYGLVDYKDMPVIIDDNSIDLYKSIAEKHSGGSVDITWQDLCHLHQMFMKPNAWFYEDEFRIVVLGAAEQMPIEALLNQQGEPMLELKKVILGHRIIENKLLCKLIKNTARKRKVLVSILGVEGNSYDFGLCPPTKI